MTSYFRKKDVPASLSLVVFFIIMTNNIACAPLLAIRTASSADIVDHDTFLIDHIVR